MTNDCNNFPGNDFPDADSLIQAILDVQEGEEEEEAAAQNHQQRQSNSHGSSELPTQPRASSSQKPRSRHKGR